MQEEVGLEEDRAASVSLSVVIPAFNESGNVEPLVERLISALDGLENDTEIIFVDDGSSDDTWDKISEVSTRFPMVAGIKLSRNFGHQHAVLAGMSFARGEAIASMDADLQHPPELLPEMYRRWTKGDKVVFTKRIEEQHLGTFKRLTSRYFYRAFSWLSGVSIAEGSSDFRLIDRQVLDELLQFQDVDLFLRGAVRWLGFEDSTSTLEFQVGERHSGTPKYNLKRMLQFASTAIISFSTKPLRLGIWLGIGTSVLAFLELAYILVQVASGVTVPGWASTVGILAFLFGILFIILGIIGLYMASIHSALQGRPRFVVSGVTGRPKAGPNVVHEA